MNASCEMTILSTHLQPLFTGRAYGVVRGAGNVAPCPRLSITPARNALKKRRTASKPTGKNGRRWNVCHVGVDESQKDGKFVTESQLTKQDIVEATISGEDAAQFSYSDQKTSSWIKFTLVLGIVLGILYYIWLDPDTGYGGAFIDFIAALSGSLEVQMVLILFVFALVHSGGAALRSSAEKVIGERAYRVLFAGLSLPLAVSAVVFFINHRYDGTQLWQLRTVPGMHEFVWTLSFISFFFLYPSTFNLLEVAAVDKPKVHMWETGIMRITRHPQMTGQLIWCVAHLLWIGNSFTLTTSIALCAHHAFGVWHGDERLSSKYGEAFDEVKSRTSIVPFAAVVEGRQQLPTDFYKEFLRLPYYAIVGVTLGAYFSHSLMQNVSHWLHW